MTDNSGGSLAPLSGLDDTNDPISRADKEFYKSIREMQRYNQVTAAIIEETNRREKLITVAELAKLNDRGPAQLTEDEKREKFCFEEWQRGKSYKQINEALRRHPDWEHFKNEKSVRRLIQKWGDRIGDTRRAGQPGRRKSSS